MTAFRTQHQGLAALRDHNLKEGVYAKAAVPLPKGGGSYVRASAGYFRTSAVPPAVEAYARGTLGVPLFTAPPEVAADLGAASAAPVDGAGGVTALDAYAGDWRPSHVSRLRGPHVRPRQ